MLSCKFSGSHFLISAITFHLRNLARLWIQLYYKSVTHVSNFRLFPGLICNFLISLFKCPRFYWCPTRTPATLVILCMTTQFPQAIAWGSMPKASWGWRGSFCHTRKAGSAEEWITPREQPVSMPDESFTVPGVRQLRHILDCHQGFSSAAEPQ